MLDDLGLAALRTQFSDQRIGREIRMTLHYEHGGEFFQIDIIPDYLVEFVDQQTGKKVYKLLCN
jgi:hypothetical protein